MGCSPSCVGNDGEPTIGQKGHTLNYRLKFSNEKEWKRDFYREEVLEGYGLGAIWKSIFRSNESYYPWTTEKVMVPSLNEKFAVATTRTTQKDNEHSESPQIKSDLCKGNWETLQKFPSLFGVGKNKIGRYHRPIRH